MSTDSNPNYLPAVPQTGIGSSYLIRQVAGSERMGGVQVALRKRVDENGSIEVVPTEFR